MPSLSHQIGKVAVQPKPKCLWEGPCGTGPEGGITFSNLSKWLSCRELARLYLIDGLRPVESFNVKIEYGNLWHTAEEHYAKGSNSNYTWEQALERYARGLLKKYPMQQHDVNQWYTICAKQFTEYVKFWRSHPDVVSRKPLLSEQVFDVPYKLASGRTVRLRGKWDSVDLVMSGPNKGVWLQENKSKSNPDGERIQRQLVRDLQTQMYMIALDRLRELSSLGGTDDPLPDECLDAPLVGVRYNVIRRPLGGGKGTIVQKQPTEGTKCPACKGEGKRIVRHVNEDPCSKCGGRGRVNPQPGETRDEFIERLVEYVRTEPEHYFMRWEVPVSPTDIAKFREQTLDNMLEQLCDWYEWVSLPEGRKNPFANCVHYTAPYGVWNSLAEDRTGEYDNCIESGSINGLTKVDTLFRELTV